MPALQCKQGRAVYTREGYMDMCTCVLCECGGHVGGHVCMCVCVFVRTCVSVIERERNGIVSVKMHV